MMRLTSLAVLSLALASCDGDEPAPTTIPVYRLVGATVETGPDLFVSTLAQTVQVGERESTCGGATVDCADAVVENPTVGRARVTLDRDVRLDGPLVPAGTDVAERLGYPEFLPFAGLQTTRPAEATLAPRLDAPDGTRLTAVWTTTEGDPITATATLRH